MKFLLSYEIGRRNQPAIFGCAYWNMPGLTQSALEKAARELLDDVRKKHPGHEFETLIWRSVTKLEREEPPHGLPAVAGNLECSNAEFERRCLLMIEDEQQKLAPDNTLIALLADAVRLAREYSAAMKYP